MSKRSTSHSYQGSITQKKHWQIQKPSVFNKLLKAPRQLELPHSSIPHTRGAPSNSNYSRLFNVLHLQVQFSTVSSHTLQNKQVKVQLLGFQPPRNGGRHARGLGHSLGLMPGVGILGFLGSLEPLDPLGQSLACSRLTGA